MPKYFDIHTHVNFKAYDEDRNEVIQRAFDAGVWHTNVGTQIDTSKKAVEIAEKYEEGVYATIGLHPVHTAESYLDKQEIGSPAEALAKEGGDKSVATRAEQFDFSAYKELAEHKKVVAIGECGLDYFRLEEDTKKIQKDAFEAHIELANEVGKPLMIHVRNAYEDTLEILKSVSKVPSNIHFFAGDIQIAKQFLELGSTLSFTGVVTFTTDYDEVIKYVPLDRIMSETDAPYVTPKPHRGKRNEPSYVQYVAKRLAEIKGLSEEDVEVSLVSNALTFFNLKPSK